MQAFCKDLIQQGYRLVESPRSWVFIASDEIWKIKKPIVVTGVDRSTPDLRRASCEREILLNRALAPDVYLGVVPITLEPSGHRINGNGEPVDWAIHMRRLSGTDRADRRLAEDRLSHKQLEAIVRRLVSFHEETERSREISEESSLAKLGSRLKDIISESHGDLSAYLQPSEALEIETWQTRFLEEKQELFEERARSGRIRDIHGDLRLDQIYIYEDDSVIILDRSDIDPDFRWEDVCCDVASLSMDLTLHSRADLSERFLALYAHHANDYGLFGVVDFYESCYASVRGTLSALFASDESANPKLRDDAAKEARRHFLFALASKRAPLIPPAVVAMSGLVASGKSTVAKAVASNISSPIVLSDRTRDVLLELEPGEKASLEALEKHLAPQFPEKVYAEVFRAVENVLSSGRPVVVDGCFGTRERRKQIRSIAMRFDVPFLFVECRVSEQITQERLLERSKRDGVTESEWKAIYDEFQIQWEEVEELARPEHAIVDTGQPLKEIVSLLRTLLPMWPKGFTG